MRKHKNVTFCENGIGGLRGFTELCAVLGHGLETNGWVQGEGVQKIVKNTESTTQDSTNIVKNENLDFNNLDSLRPNPPTSAMLPRYSPDHHPT